MKISHSIIYSLFCILVAVVGKNGNQVGVLALASSFSFGENHLNEIMVISKSIIVVFENFIISLTICGKISYLVSYRLETMP